MTTFEIKNGNTSTVVSNNVAIPIFDWNNYFHTMSLQDSDQIFEFENNIDLMGNSLNKKSSSEIIDQHLDKYENVWKALS